jgi:hypothetical protein
MSGFPPTYFHREPRNLRACTIVPAAVAAALAVLPALTIVDLACETGSMLRALAPHLPALQNGKLVDNDLDLLVRAADVFHPALGVTTTQIDLGRDLKVALDRSLDLAAVGTIIVAQRIWTPFGRLPQYEQSQRSKPCIIPS